jgi:hypothetical protein
MVMRRRRFEVFEGSYRKYEKVFFSQAGAQKFLGNIGFWKTRQS